MTTPASVSQSFAAFVAGLEDLSDADRVLVATGFALALRLDSNVDLPPAPISQRLTEIVESLSHRESEEGGLLDELRRRREQREAGRSDEAERTARAD